MAKLGSIKDIYSEDTLKAQQTLAQIEASKPGDYQSQYTDKINTALNDILNRKKFSYDFNADPLYQQYKDQYTQLGNQAMKNTVASAAAMTGGYGNSYGVTAGAQANQAYLQQLNNVIPELYNAALQKYDMETQDLYNKYSALGNQEDREYGQYRDKVADWQTDRGYYNDKYTGAVANDQYVANFNEEYERWLAEMQYQKERDAIADAQWQQQFDYQKQQDAIAYAASQAASGESSGRSSGGSSQSTKKTSENEHAVTQAATKNIPGATYGGSQSTVNSVQKVANFIKNNSANSGAYKQFLVDEVNKGKISAAQAVKIRENIK